MHVVGRGTFELLNSQFVACEAQGVGAAVRYDPKSPGETPIFDNSDFLDSHGLSTVSVAAYVDWACSDGQYGVRSARARRLAL